LTGVGYLGVLYKYMLETVGIYGDSNTAGFRPTLDKSKPFPSGYDFYSPTQIWTNQLVGIVSKVIIDARCGRTIGNYRSMPSKILGDTNGESGLRLLLKNNPFLTQIIISLGTNDFDKLQKTHGEVLDCVANLEKVIRDNSQLLSTNTLWVLSNFCSTKRTSDASRELYKFSGYMLNSGRNTVDLSLILVDAVDGMHWSLGNHHEIGSMVRDKY
jgi:hypothetical protein